MKKLKIETFSVNADEADAKFIIDTITNIKLYLEKHPEEVIPFFATDPMFLHEWFLKHLGIRYNPDATFPRTIALRGVISQLIQVFLRIVRAMFPSTFSSKTNTATLKKLTELYVTYYTLNNNFIAFPYMDSLNAIGLTVLNALKFRQTDATLQYGLENIEQTYKVLTISPLEEKSDDANRDPIVFVRALKNAIDMRNPYALSLLFNLNDDSRSKSVENIAMFIKENLMLKFAVTKKTPELDNACRMAIHLVSGNLSLDRSNTLGALLKVIFQHRGTYKPNNFGPICSTFLDLLSDFEYTVTIAKHPKSHPVLGMSVNGTHFQMCV